MDETGFAQRSKSRKVAAVRGSPNVWSRSVEANFHLTVVACASPDGHAIPPVFIVPGERLRRDILDGCPVEGSRVTAAPRGFMNSRVFLSWLEHFSESIPPTTVRPVLLVYDGCSGHYSEETIRKAISQQVILILLPPNATHLVQPMDVAVSRPLKTALQHGIATFAEEAAASTIQKKDAVALAGWAWNSGIVKRPENIVAGFRTAGIWPLSFPNMQKRLNRFR